MSHIAYKCDVCDRSFPTKQECDEHELDHKLSKEMAEKIPAKYHEGDIVKFGNDAHLYVVQRAVMMKDMFEMYRWHYELSHYSNSWFAMEPELKMVLPYVKYKLIVNDIDNILREHGLKIESVYKSGIDGHPVLEICSHENQ